MKKIILCLLATSMMASAATAADVNSEKVKTEKLVSYLYQFDICRQSPFVQNRSEFTKGMLQAADLVKNKINLSVEEKMKIVKSVSESDEIRNFRLVFLAQTFNRGESRDSSFFQQMVCSSKLTKFMEEFGRM